MTRPGIEPQSPGPLANTTHEAQLVTGEIRSFITFQRALVITRLEFELVFFDVAVQNVCHCATGTPPNQPVLHDGKMC